MNRIEIIKTMIAGDNKNAYAWYLLGKEYSDQQMFQQALEAFSKALTFSDAQLKNMIFEELDALQHREHTGSAGDKTGSAGDKTGSAEDRTGSENKSGNVNNVGNEFFSGEDAETEDAEAEDDNTEYTKENDTEDDNVVPFKIIEGGRLRTDSGTGDKGLDVISFQDVGGLDQLKEIINMKIVKPFINPGLFNRFKKKVGGGVLLYGPPGCGKTFMARATAGECHARFIPVHITDILNPYLGVSEQNIKDIFSNARAKKPSILFFDELDTVGFSRAKLSSEHMRPITDQLLTEIEGVDSNTDRLLILGATNMPWDIDSAFKRPGRFDKMVFVAPPDEAARVAIFKLKLKEKPVEEMDYSVLAKNTELYSGADIENVIEVATEQVIIDILNSGTERLITMNDLMEAISNTRPSTLEWLKTVRNYVKYANQAGLYDDVEKYLSKNRKMIN